MCGAWTLIVYRGLLLAVSSSFFLPIRSARGVARRVNPPKARTETAYISAACHVRVKSEKFRWRHVQSSAEICKYSSIPFTVQIRDTYNVLTRDACAYLGLY